MILVFKAVIIGVSDKKTLPPIEAEISFKWCRTGQSYKYFTKSADK